MPYIFELETARRERFAEENDPEPLRSIILKICAYERAETAFTDRFTDPDADPQTCSMYLDMMIEAVRWMGIVGRFNYLSPIFGLRLDFKDYHPKKRLKGKSGFLRLLFAILIGPIRDRVPFMSTTEMQEIRRLTKTPESEKRIAWAKQTFGRTPVV